MSVSLKDMKRRCDHGDTFEADEVEDLLNIIEYSRALIQIDPEDLASLTAENARLVEHDREVTKRANPINIERDALRAHVDDLEVT